jgi:small subunit ribosomal protein S17
MPKKEKIGKVVSSKMDKTIVVAVTEKYQHPRLAKIQSKTIKFKAHDENNSCIEGAIVRIVECRPISKEKKWQLASILERSQEV